MTDISRQLRLYLERSSQALSSQDVYTLLDDFVSDCNASEEPEVSICNLENELQVIRDTLDLSECAQTEDLLCVLRHLEPVLSSTSLISTWFDLALRTALREPRLSQKALTQAKDLVIIALEKPDNRHPEIQGEFRRRILDLYLLDASNEADPEDVLEWADLPREQRDQRKIWKENLEDILVVFGMDQPEVRSSLHRMKPGCEYFGCASLGILNADFPLFCLALLAPATDWSTQSLHYGTSLRTACIRLGVTPTYVFYPHVALARRFHDCMHDKPHDAY